MCGRQWQAGLYAAETIVVVEERATIQNFGCLTQYGFLLNPKLEKILILVPLLGRKQMARGLSSFIPGIQFSMDADLENNCLKVIKPRNLNIIDSIQQMFIKCLLWVRHSAGTWDYGRKQVKYILYSHTGQGNY